MCKLSLFVIFLLLSACSWQEKPEPVISDGRPEHVPVNITTVADAIPQYELWSASVNPESYTVLGKTYKVLATNQGYKQQGIASWYGTKFHQKKTATGEVYDMYQMTAAHKTLPIPSYVRVTNLKNQREVIVKVNDRGPFHEHRIIDLSYAASVRLGLDKAGTGFVEVAAVQAGEAQTGENATSAKKVYLQLGAFGTLENALLLQQKVVDLHLTSRVVMSKIADSTLYKVQVGPITSVIEADNIIDKMKQIGIDNSRFVTE